MPVNGNLTSKTYGEKTVISAIHPAVILSLVIAAGSGVMSPGLILAEGADGKAIPYDPAVATNLGAGDGVVTDFSGTLSGLVQPGSVSITDGTQTLTDDGFGVLSGDGSGTVNYKTGAVAVSFTAAPANTIAVDATHGNKVVGVNAYRTDATAETVAAVVKHGCVVLAALSVKAGSAPGSADIAYLTAATIYPVS